MRVCLLRYLIWTIHLSHGSQTLFFFPLWAGEVGSGPWNWVTWVLDFWKKLNKINKGWTLAAKLPGRSAGRGEWDRAIDGAEESDEWKGQDGTAQPPLLGEIFLDSTPGSQCQTISLCSATAKAEAGKPQGHGPHLYCWQKEGGRGEGRNWEEVERSQEAGRHAPVPGLK